MAKYVFSTQTHTLFANILAVLNIEIPTPTITHSSREYIHIYAVLSIRCDPSLWRILYISLFARNRIISSAVSARRAVLIQFVTVAMARVRTNRAILRLWQARARPNDAMKRWRKLIRRSNSSAHHIKRI